MAKYSQDPINIKGIGALLNPQMSKAGASFIDLEDEIIGSHTNHKKNREEVRKPMDPNDKFSLDLENLSNSFGLNLSTKVDMTEKNKSRRDDSRRDDSRRDDYRREESRREESNNRRRHRRPPSESSSESSSEYSESSGSDSYDSSESGSGSSDYSSESGSYDDSSDYSSSSGSYDSRRRKRHSRSSIPQPPPFGYGYNQGYGQQYGSAHPNALISSLDSGPNFTLERERYAELRSAKLEKIESMRQALDEEGIDCSKIDVVTSEDSDEKIEATYRTISSKMDRQRYCSLAEELVLAGVGGLESFFDGKRVYFGKYRPDLTDWNITVQAKLRRVRPETAMLVGQIMRDYNISPIWRILMELVPSAISHIRLKAKQNDSDGLYADADMAKAINEIHSSYD